MHKRSLFTKKKGKKIFDYEKSDKGHSRNCLDYRINDIFYVR